MLVSVIISEMGQLQSLCYFQHTALHQMTQCTAGQSKWQPLLGDGDTKSLPVSMVLFDSFNQPAGRSA